MFNISDHIDSNLECACETKLPGGVTMSVSLILIDAWKATNQRKASTTSPFPTQHTD